MKNKTRMFLGDNYNVRFRSIKRLIDGEKYILANSEEFRKEDIAQAHRTLAILDWVQKRNAKVRIETVKRPVSEREDNIETYLIFDHEEEAIECALRFEEKVSKVFED